MRTQAAYSIGRDEANGFHREKHQSVAHKRRHDTKALGLVLGFSENSADTRIAQYETGVRTPQKELLDRIADYFLVEPATLQTPDMDGYICVIETLNEIESMCRQASQQLSEYIRCSYQAPLANGTKQN